MPILSLSYLNFNAGFLMELKFIFILAYLPKNSMTKIQKFESFGFSVIKLIC